MSHGYAGQVVMTLPVFLLMCSTFFGPTSLSFMLYPCEEVTLKGFIHDRQLGCLIWRRDTLTCGKQSDFLPATVALMLVIMMFFLHWGLGTQSSAKYMLPVDPRPLYSFPVFTSGSQRPRHIHHHQWGWWQLPHWSWIWWPNRHQEAGPGEAFKILAPGACRWRKTVVRHEAEHHG